MSDAETPPGRLRTYLGSAPGVGKTYSMLAEGRRRAEAGERVVVGWIERHGRSETRAQLGELDVIPPRQATYRGSIFPELDVDGVLVAQPDLVLVDELAHSVPDTGRRRWEDVAELLAAGLDVATTANVANLESVRDYAARLTGVGVVESIPDQFVRAGEVVVVPIAVDALRRRIAAGKVYSADRVGGALAEYFQAINLEALNELCEAWVTDRVDDVGGDLLARRGLSARPTVVAAVSGSERGEAVIRAAATLCRRSRRGLRGYPRRRLRRSVVPQPRVGARSGPGRRIGRALSQDRGDRPGTSHRRCRPEKRSLAGRRGPGTTPPPETRSLHHGLSPTSAAARHGGRGSMNVSFISPA